MTAVTKKTKKVASKTESTAQVNAIDCVPTSLQNEAKVSGKKSTVSKISNSEVPQTVSAKVDASNDELSLDFTIVRTMSRGYEPDMLGLLSTLESRRTQWEENSYRQSNQGLYKLLAECLMFCGDISNANSKNRMLALKSFYKDKGYNFNKEASLAKKVVGAVFGEIERRRIGTYAVVIDAATTAKVQPVDLPKWIESNGGIQAIRLSKSSSYVSPTNKCEYVSDNFDVLPSLGNFKSSKLSAQTDSNKNGKNCVLLATQKADGSFEIRHLVYNSSALKAAQVSIYKEHQQIVAKTASKKVKA